MKKAICQKMQIVNSDSIKYALFYAIGKIRIRLHLQVEFATFLSY